MNIHYIKINNMHAFKNNFSCYGICPFWDFGDSGYGEDCNLLSRTLFMTEKTKLLYKRYWKIRMAISKFLDEKYKKLYNLKAILPYESWIKRNDKVDKCDKKWEKKRENCYNYFHRCPLAKGEQKINLDVDVSP